MTTRLPLLLLLLTSILASCQAKSLHGFPQLRFIRCYQSSTHAGHSHCGKAIDMQGSTSTCSGEPKNAITKHQTRPYWHADFGEPMYVDHVRIYNRADTFLQNRLVNFRVMHASGHVCARYNSHKTFRVKDFKCQGITGGIRIELNGAGHLELCEVEAYGRRTFSANAFRHPIRFNNCHQSNRYRAHSDCHKAMDLQNSHCSSGEQYNSINNPQHHNWWVGTFNKPHHVGIIQIYARMETILTQGIRNFDVITSTGKVCGKYHYLHPTGAISFFCDDTVTSIKIQTRDTRFLELCEVFAFPYVGGPIYPKPTPKPTTAPARIHGRCLDPYTYEEHEFGSRWVSKEEEYCYHYKCGANRGRPIRTDCRDNAGKCVQATHKGKKFSCSAGTCDCIRKGPHTYIREHHHYWDDHYYK